MPEILYPSDPASIRYYDEDLIRSSGNHLVLGETELDPERFSVDVTQEVQDLYTHPIFRTPYDLKFFRSQDEIETYKGKPDRWGAYRGVSIDVRIADANNAENYFLPRIDTNKFQTIGVLVQEDGREDAAAAIALKDSDNEDILKIVTSLPPEEYLEWQSEIKDITVSYIKKQALVKRVNQTNFLIRKVMKDTMKNEEKSMPIYKRVGRLATRFEAFIDLFGDGMDFTPRLRIIESKPKPEA